tara:strand:+ start:85 stop:945 length:861 start_codon:yes stop_codon:yes gene_type:complete
MKIIYVAGLYHTGSTLMDLTLGNLPKVIGLGEIYKGLREGFEEMCSCGQLTKDCSFWGDIHKTLKEKKDLDLQAKYDLVISTFVEKYGQDYILVDSSKCHPFDLSSNKSNRDMQGLNFLVNKPEIDLKVIHMVRDVRSWSYGLLMRDERTKDELSLINQIYRKFSRSASARFLQWYWGHKKILNFLKKYNVENLRVSYEDLALDTEVTLNSITDFLEMNYDPSMLIPSKSKSHIVVGNPMRFRKADTKKIKYDSRWLSSNKFYFSSIFLRPIMNFNNKLTYNKKSN